MTIPPHRPADPACYSRLRDALADFRRTAGSHPGEAVLQDAIGRLVEIASAIDHPTWETLASGEPALREEHARLGPVYGRHIFRQEVEAAAAFFESLARSGRFDHEALTPWGVSAYRRMRDLFDHVDFTSRRHLIMVGSGPLPVTLIHVHERTAVPRLTSVDVAPSAAEAITRLREGLGWHRLEAITGNGLETDYGDADVVYLANLISPKREILRRVAEQVAPGTPVIVRDPDGPGELFAETAARDLPPGLRHLGAGGGDGRFLSRNVFLVRE